MSRRPMCFAVAILLLLASCSRPASPRLVLATTTSVGNSGLLDNLLPAYQREAHVVFGVHLAGSGRALAMLADEDADLVISHAPEAELRTLGGHQNWWYRKIMYNDFVLVGPPADPEDVRHAGSLEDAMRRIARGRTAFFSRADSSGTHEREQLLWTIAGTRPPEEQLVATGSGMGATLRVANAQRGYTLTDRATLTQLAKELDLHIVSEGDPRLINTYSVIVNPDRPVTGELGMAFGRWLTDGHGRERIDAYRLSGNVHGFFVWPLDHPRTRPGDLPTH
jgi:tungstate transport system substrate-binding protein